MDEGITFAARKGGWIAIKKLSAYEDTKPAEIVGVLMGIRQAIDRKIFSFTGIDTFALDEIAARMAKGKRKGYASASELLSAPKPKEEILSACESPSSLPAAEAYLNKALLAEIKFSFEVDTDDFNKAFPEFKVSKPRGNFGKKKKK